MAKGFMSVINWGEMYYNTLRESGVDEAGRVLEQFNKFSIQNKVRQVAEDSSEIKWQRIQHRKFVKNHGQYNNRQGDDEHGPPGVGPAPVMADGREQGTKAQNGGPFKFASDHQRQVQDDQATVE